MILKDFLIATLDFQSNMLSDTFNEGKISWRFSQVHHRTVFTVDTINRNLSKLKKVSLKRKDSFWKRWKDVLEKICASTKIWKLYILIYENFYQETFVIKQQQKTRKKIPYKVAKLKVYIECGLKQFWDPLCADSTSHIFI